MDELTNQEMKSSSELAQDKLNSAVDKFTSTTATVFDNAVDAASDSLSDAIESVTASILSGIREIKSELDVSRIANESPWGLVAGSFVGGAMLEHFTSKLSPRLFTVEDFSTSSRNSNRSAMWTGLATPLLFAASQWGLQKFLDSRSKN